MIAIDLEKYRQLLEKSYEQEIGRVVKMVGLTIEASGPMANLNDVCYITEENQNQKKAAEVVGFRENRILLMPYDDMTGVGIGSLVENSGTAFRVPVGEQLLGKTLDGLGNPMDETELNSSLYYPAEAPPPDPLKRRIIDEVLPLGVKAVDGLLTVGKGQRIGIFAGSGVGKSTLLGMFARNTKDDINVIALIGERGREVR